MPWTRLSQLLRAEDLFLQRRAPVLNEHQIRTFYGPVGAAGLHQHQQALAETSYDRGRERMAYGWIAKSGVGRSEVNPERDSTRTAIRSGPMKSTAVLGPAHSARPILPPFGPYIWSSSYT